MLTTLGDQPRFPKVKSIMSNGITILYHENIVKDVIIIKPLLLPPPDTRTQLKSMRVEDWGGKRSAKNCRQGASVMNGDGCYRPEVYPLCNNLLYIPNGAVSVPCHPPSVLDS